MKRAKPGWLERVVPVASAAVLAVAAVGCETPTHKSVRIYEYQREVRPSEDRATKKRDAKSEMVSPGRMVSPGQMVSPGSLIDQR